MIYAIAGGARMGAFQLNESLLERITRKLRDGWKRVEVLLCAMKQPSITRCFVLHRTRQ
ncbi:TPA: protease FtsH-inhibitory lysogeny factor CIII [Escherichia coli]|nr:protease FtsH-inhibitory lysogeny factor CIII [Escherichia coli]